MNAVDLACGTGRWTRQLASWGVAVTGYDYSDEALRQAEAAGPRDGLSYAIWDIVADPIPPRLVPGTFDLVTCRHGLPYLEPGRLLTDVGRWLKPDGVFFALLRVGEAPGSSSTQRWQVHNREVADEALFHLGLSEAAFSTIGAGWARREVHHLGRGLRTILLSGYGSPPDPAPALGNYRASAGFGATRPQTAPCTRPTTRSQGQATTHANRTDGTAALNMPQESARARGGKHAGCRSSR